MENMQLTIDNAEEQSVESLSESTLVEPFRPSYLHELFEQQVDAREEAVALICGESSFSYGELEDRANRLANYLRCVGIGPGRLVGLCFERSERPIVAILACLKAGGAYLPIDPSHPDDRIRFIVDEAEIVVLLTEQALLDRASKLFNGPVVALDASASEIAAQPARRLSRAETGLKPDDLCYVIYTSGTTGRPKGVMTAHCNAVHFVTAFNNVCTTTPEDRVYQGFSLSFDGSVEEIWMAFSNGASLVIGTREAPRFGNELACCLSEYGVTYFSTVPTMLSTITTDVPSLRQLVISGEVCPPELVQRWAVSGRLMLNVYGPTEATVNTTAAICEPDRPITIGRPLDGYATLILDADMRPVSNGTKGELYVGGPGVARGYLKQPDLTAKAFVTSPHDGSRLYRTGDLACINDRGEIEFFGRIDDQVKIRGFRVELSEIETALREHAPVVAAAVKLHDRDHLPCLAAYVVLDGAGPPLDRTALLEKLRATLPSYMVPAYLDVVEHLPTLTSGKVDRKRLPPPATPLVADKAGMSLPATPLESKIADVWASIFGVDQIGAEQDFFLDLGGHSLLVARSVAGLRDRTGLPVAVQDFYRFPTVRKLAGYLATQPATAEQRPTGSPVIPERIAPIPGWAVPSLQAMTILLKYGLFSAPAVLAILGVTNLLDERISWTEVGVLGLLLALLWWPAMLAVAAAAKWLIIGRYRAGAYPLWGSYFLRWWFVSQMQSLSGAGLLAGTPLMAVYYRLMGAKVGRGCALETALCSAFDLVTIGNDTSIGADTQLLGYRVENGYLILGSVNIGSRCFIGSHSALGLGVQMDDGARLDDQSLLPDGQTITAGEQRRGSPAQVAEVSVPEEEGIRQASRVKAALFGVLQLVLIHVQAFLVGVPALTASLLFFFVWSQYGSLGLAILFATAAIPLLTVAYCLWIALLKAVWLRRAEPGVYPLYSAYYLRHWMAAGLMRASRALLLPVFTTIYLPPWMRLLGARIGAHAEMSTIWSVMPDLLDAGEGSFFADGCILGGRRVFRGQFEIRVNRVGRRSFVGNGAILPVGASLGERCLLGVLSMPPSRKEPTPDGSDWLGSPGFRLPNRQKVGGFDDSVTFCPTTKLYAQRAVVDICRILIPNYIGLASVAVGITALFFANKAFGLAAMLALSPVIGLATGLLAVLMVVILKWVVMGTFKPVIVPLWCPYVWFNEMINGAYESVMAPVVATFSGTPFAAPLLRLLGCKIGRHGYIGTTLFSEFDLVKIGDHAALNAGAVIQTHLFEDRIMKSSYVRIGDGCSVGNMSVVLYDGAMETGTVLGPLSLLMKGEVVPAGTRWHGIPTVKG